MLVREKLQNDPPAIFGVAVFVAVIVGFVTEPPLQTVIQALILLLGGIDLALGVLKAPMHQRFYIGLLMILTASYILIVNEGNHVLRSLAVVVVVNVICSRK
jgi:hypothetical protein